MAHENESAHRSVVPMLRHHGVAFVRELCVVVIGALVVSCLLRVFVGQVFDIPSISMNPTLAVGDRVLVEKISDVRRGQIVVFHDPGGWLNHPVSEAGPVRHALEVVGVLPPVASDHVIKRIIGMPGDHVVCCDGSNRIYINGHSIDESYLGQQASTTRFDVVVPAGHVFVLGDNRSQSRDSRCHLGDPGQAPGANAFVPMDLIVGRALVVAWPWSRWDSLAAPEVYGTVPDGRGDPPTAPKITAGAEARC